MEMIFAVAVLMLLLTAGLVLAVAKPKVAKQVTAVFLAIAAAGGILIYGYSYIVLCDNLLLALLRTIPAVCGMFVGNDSLADIEAMPFMQNGWMQTLFWIIHCYAIYATVSTVVTTVGAVALQKMRLRFFHRRRVHLIYGVNDDTVSLGERLSESKHGGLVFVDEQADSSVKDRIFETGGVFRGDTHALYADKTFMRSIGCGRKKRQITLYALSEKASDNIAYAKAVLDTLQQLAIEPKRTRLVILAQEELTVNRLQVTGERYGYGYVTAINNAQLAARVLVRNYPPCHTVRFDETGKATENFEALIIGFGTVGQAVLKSLIMSGQFQGSEFRATVFSPDCQTVDGRISSQFGEIFRNYHICLEPYDARSRRLYQFIDGHGSGLKYAVICAGDEKRNHELAEDLATYFKRGHIDVPIYLCSHRGVIACDRDGVVKESHDLYEPELLSNDELDRMAMILNHRYQPVSENSALQNWMRCDYFSRQSCRAAADFTQAVLYAAGKTVREVKEKGWELSEEQLENLSRTEHLRWCAFHYAMGFRRMDDDTFAQRAEQYRRQVQAQGSATIRIGKDMDNYTHACLVDWEALETLSAKEEAVTGKFVDYKAMDTNNVLAIPELLRALEDGQ